MSNNNKNTFAIGKYDPINTLDYRLSNEYAFAKYKSTLLGNKLTKIGIAKLESGKTIPGYPNRVAIYPGELMTLFGKSQSIYSNLKRVANEMLGKRVFMESNGKFIGFNEVTTVAYDKAFIIEFNDVVVKNTLEVKNNFMLGKVPVAALMKSNASLQLYDILKASLYKKKIEINYYELLFTLGLANIDNNKVSKKVLDSIYSVDWKELYYMLPEDERKYSEWRGFRRRVLEVAQQELKEKSDIYFDFEKIRGEDTILFTIYKNDKYKEVEGIFDNYSDKGQMNISSYLHEELYKKYVGRNGLREADIELLIDDANGNDELIEKAFEYVDQQENVSNYMGYLRDYIKAGGYDDNIKVVHGSVDLAAAHEQIEEKMHSDEVKNSVWNKITKKENFKDFLNYMEFNGISEKMLTEVLDVQDRLDAYMNWFRNINS